MEVAGWLKQRSEKREESNAINYVREIAVKLMRSSRLERWKGEIARCILGALRNESQYKTQLVYEASKYQQLAIT